jgi:eukaryotic-like serine/threonine-protein kinase
MDAQQVGTLLHTLGSHTGEVYSLAWSPDGCYLASAGADKTIFITERATQRVFQLPGEHTKTISSLVWSPDGTLLGSGGHDGFIHIWDVVARRKLWTYHGHRDPTRWRATLIGQTKIFSLAWSPDGRWIASGGDDAIAQVWEVLSGKTYYQYRGHAAGQDEDGFHAAVAISSVAWSPDGSRLATAGCKISDKLEQDLFFNTLRSIPGISNFVAWNEYAKVHVWDALTGDHVLIYPHHKIGVTALAWSPNGTYIASAGKDKTVHVWKPDALCSPTRFTQNAFSGHTDQVKAVVWSPDGTYIASAGKDSTVQVWKVSTGERIYTYRGHTKCVRALAWSPDGNSLASAGDEKTIHIWRGP